MSNIWNICVSLMLGELISSKQLGKNIFIESLMNEKHCLNITR